MRLASRTRSRSRKSRRATESLGVVRGLAPVRFGRDAYAELRKAHWPNREQTMRLTALVLAISLLMATVLGLADFAFARLFELVAT